MITHHLMAHHELYNVDLADIILKFNEESRVILEAARAYHLPALSYLKQKGIFVAVINPVIMCQETGLKRNKVESSYKI